MTPPAELAMGGYGNRKLPSTGPLDPLFARVGVLEAGETRLALVALDLGWPFGPASLGELRQAATPSTL